MRSDFKQKSLLIQSLSDVLSGSVPVFVRIFPGDFSYVRTKSDTVIGRSAAMTLRGGSRGNREFRIQGQSQMAFVMLLRSSGDMEGS